MRGTLDGGTPDVFTLFAKMAENFSYRAIKLDTSGQIQVNGTVYSTLSDVDWESTSNCVYCYKTWCGQLYVGATTMSLRKRFVAHKKDCKKCRTTKLYQHFKTCCYCTGPPTLYVLEITLDKQQLNSSENWYIVAFDTIKTGLNQLHNFSGQSQLPAAVLEKVNPEALEVRREYTRKRNRKRRQDPVQKAKINESAKLRKMENRKDPVKRAKMNESLKLWRERARQDPLKKAKMNQSSKLRMREYRRRLKEQAEQEKLQAQ